jgi:thiamine pyrophosphate-dependent acetolactate synthase large subunit-like protein
MFARGGFAAVEAAGCCVLIGADPGSANHYRVTSRSRGPVFLLQSVAADDEGSRVCAVPAPTGCDIEPVVVSTESNLFVATLAGVRERLDDSDISVVDAGNHEVWARTMLPITGRRCCIGGSDWASMGFALPTAIAARAVETDARIVCVTGDGCLLMSLTDLSTFFELGGPSILIVLNDSEYGMMSDVQRAGFGTAYASELPRVDVAAVARALGGEGARIETRSQLAPALDQAFSARRPFVLDVVCASPAMSDLGYFQTRSTCP